MQLIEIMKECKWNGWDVDKKLLAAAPNELYSFERSDDQMFLRFSGKDVHYTSNKQTVSIARTVQNAVEGALYISDNKTGIRCAVQVPGTDDINLLLVVANDIPTGATPTIGAYSQIDNVTWPLLTPQYTHFKMRQSYKYSAAHRKDVAGFLAEVQVAHLAFVQFITATRMHAEMDIASIEMAVLRVSQSVHRSKICGQMTTRTQYILDYLREHGFSRKNVLTAFGKYTDEFTTIRPHKRTKAQSRINHILFQEGFRWKHRTLMYFKDQWR